MALLHCLKLFAATVAVVQLVSRISVTDAYRRQGDGNAPPGFGSVIPDYTSHYGGYSTLNHNYQNKSRSLPFPYRQRGINYLDNQEDEDFPSQTYVVQPATPIYHSVVNMTKSSALVGPKCRPDYDPPNSNSNGICVASGAIGLCSDMATSASKDCQTFNYGQAVCCYCTRSMKWHENLPYRIQHPSGTGSVMSAYRQSRNIRRACYRIHYSACHFSDRVQYIAVTSMTSTTTPSPTTLAPPNGAFVNSHIALVREQQCGIPNIPDMFDALQQSPAVISAQKVKAKFALPPNERRSKALKGHFTQFKGVAKDPLVRPKIVGGFDAPSATGSICWHVEVGTDSPTYATFYCGGVIVGSRTIITAGHCLLNTTAAEFNASAVRVNVTIGVKATKAIPGHPPVSFLDGCSRTYEAAMKIPHPDYDPMSANNDIALLVLSEPIDFRENSGCACKLCLSNKFAKPGDRCVTAGFGDEVDMFAENVTNTPPRPFIPMKYVLTTILDPAERCSWVLDNPWDLANQTDWTLNICAGGVEGEDTCQGDSGSSLFCRDAATGTQYLAGITTSGLGCARPIGAIYTRIDAYLPWIFNTAPLGDVSIMQ